MKNRISLKSMFLFIGIVLMLMNLSIWPINFVLAAIHIIITISIISICFVYFKESTPSALVLEDNVEDIKNFLNKNSGDILEVIPMPVVVVKAVNLNDVLFYNESFKTCFLDKGRCVNVGVSELFPKETSESLIEKGTVDFQIDDEKYKVYAKVFYGFLVLYFNDETAIRDLNHKYLNSRLCVGYALIDNKDEIKQCLSDEEVLRVFGTAQNVLQKWITLTGGAFEKIGTGKYVILFEEKNLKALVKDKFKILEKIHEIKFDDQKCVTVSIGISRAASSLEESKTGAKNALDMALGRGGDQVAIKNKVSYEFFGGASGGIEKRSKVRTRVFARALMEKIESADLVFIMGHKFSDFDSIGAAVALRGICYRNLKKKCYVVVNKNQSLSWPLIKYLEENDNSGIFISPQQALGMVTPNSLLLVVDTHSTKFIEDSKLYEKSKNVAVIDHHRLSVDKISNAVIFFHEPFASSTCEMVTEMVQYMNAGAIKRIEAEALLAGIMLDTKNFSVKTGIRTFEAAAYLKKQGTDNYKVKKLFANSMESYKIKGKVIENTEVIKGCAISHLDYPKENVKVVCAQAADELLGIKDIQASFVIFMEQNTINVCARSMGKINVQVIMEALGGGGHQTIAATQINGETFESVKKKLIKEIEENYLYKNNNGDEKNESNINKRN